MSSRRFPSLIFATLAVIALVAFGVVLLSGSDDESDDDGAAAGNPETAVTLAEAQAPAKDAPPELQRLRDEANQLLDGGLDAFDARVEELAGTPIVVNKWASWCGPCRFEFPFFQAQALKLGDEVAFIGIDSNDGAAEAETFLSQLPLPYPSYEDPDLDIADSLGAQRDFPSTIYIGSDGEIAYVHRGVYADEEALAADIERYAQ